MIQIVKIYEFLLEAIGKLIEQVVVYTPTILGAFLMLLTGYVIGKILYWLTYKISAKLGIDRAVENLGLGKSLQSAEIKTKPSKLLGRLVFWVIMLTFIMAAFDTLGIHAVAQSFQKLIAYIPNLLVGVIIAVIGLFVAQALRSATEVALNRMGVDFQDQIASLVYYAVLVITTLSVLRQLQIDISAFEQFIFLAVATVFLFGGAVLAWGIRSSIEAIIAGYYLRQLIEPEQELNHESNRGKVEKIASTHTVLKTSKGRLLVPNADLLKHVIAIQKES